MRKIIDLSTGEVLGEVSWREIDSAIRKISNFLEKAVIKVSPSDLLKLDEDSKSLKSLIENHLKKTSSKTPILGVSDTVCEEHDFVCRGYLKDVNGKPLSSYKLWFYDRDYVEDDYLSSVITDKDGFFSFSFFSSDFGYVERVPDFVAKIFKFENGDFIGVIDNFKIENFEVFKKGNITHINFGEIVLDLNF